MEFEYEKRIFNIMISKGEWKMSNKKELTQDNEITAVEEIQGEVIELTLDALKEQAKAFCDYQQSIPVHSLYGVSDGKAVGTYIEKQFKLFISKGFTYSLGNAAKGIDLPGDEISTDIKVTSIKQPQSSSPFKSARQKIYGLGYNLLLFVYNKVDDPETQAATFEFVSCAFIDKARTADFQATKNINQILANDGTKEDLFAYFEDIRLPGDDIIYNMLAEEVISNPPMQGYLSISNALQWRLQYRRIVDLNTPVEGIDKIV